MTVIAPPPQHTPIAALPVLVLDLETTGLDVARDRIVQVGAAAMLGSRILEAPRIDRHIDPGMPIPESSTRIHGITSADVAGAAPFADFAAELRDVMAGRIIVGQHIAFDLAVLRHEAARAGLAWPAPIALDVGHLAGALEPALVDLGLESLAARFSVEVRGRHDALADSLISARIFAALLPRLRDSDVRTLGEALSLAARRGDLTRREAEAGWHAQPGDAPSGPVALPLARVDSHLFVRRIDDVMRSPVEGVAGDTTIRQAAQRMVERRIGALLIGSGPTPDGIVTERDILRALADAGIDPDVAPVTRIMSSPVETVRGEELLYRALARMDRAGVRHLCVRDADGAAVGMVSQRDLLHHRARAAAALGDAVTYAPDAPGLAAVHARLPDVARGLVAERISGVEIARVLSNEIRSITARTAAIAIDEMGTPAPAPWCLLVLGSGGRGESLLSADQDNAVVHRGGPQDDAWFAQLGARLADLLDEAGVPRCQGGVMVSNAAWRGSETEWRQRVDGWLRRARGDDLLHVDIFYDLIPVAGEFSLGESLQADAVAAASANPTFINLLAESVARMPPPLGLFGRLRATEGRVDLKIGGLLPLVGIARTLALRVGSTARSTPERIEDARAAGRLAESDAALLAAIHDALLTRVLEQQLADLDAGVRPSSRVDLRRLSRGERRHLASDLGNLKSILSLLHSSTAR